MEAIVVAAVVGLLIILLCCFTFLKSGKPENQTKTSANDDPIDREPWLSALIRDMYRKDICDQHLARNIIAKSLTEHFSKQHHPITGTPGKRRKKQPLVLIFAGSTGTGKTFLAENVILPHFKRKFTEDACQSYIGSAHFANTGANIIEHREKLRKEVLQKVSKHRHSLFLFDEINKMSSEVLNELSFYFAERNRDDGVVLWDSVFIFLTDAGGKKINTIIENNRPIETWGTRREDLEEDRDHFTFVQQLEEAIGNQAGGLQHVEFIRDRLYTKFVPFFPLERSHVRQCIKVEARKLNYGDSNAIAEDIMKNEMTWFPSTSRLYSDTGAKQVYLHVQQYVGRQRQEAASTSSESTSDSADKPFSRCEIL